MGRINDTQCQERDVCHPCSSCRQINRDELIEILDIHLKTQLNHMPASDFMEKVQRNELAPSWRKRICEWMIEASDEFEMDMDTVSCAVSLMDRYLSEFQADKVLLQLLGMVALYVASKMHESQPMTMEELDLLSRGKFSRRDIRDVEKQLLNVVSWQLSPPTAHTFVGYLSCFIQDQDVREELMADVLVILDQTIKDHTFVKFLPSTVALSSIVASSMRKRRGINPWVAMGVEALAWPTGRVSECKDLILAKTPHVVSPSDVATRSSRALKVVRSDSPTSAEELDRMNINAAICKQQEPTLVCNHVLNPKVSHKVLSVPMNSSPKSSKRMKLG